MASDNPAPVRPLSASQHSGIDKALKDSFVFDMKLVDAASDFVSGGAINEDFVKTVMVMDLASDELQEMSREEWTDYLNEQEEKHEKEPIFYVKVSTAATDRSFTTSVMFCLMTIATRLKDTDFLRTYPVNSSQSDRCCCLLMAERGRRIEDKMTWTLDEFNPMFRELWEKTIALSKRAAYHHGDIAKHNIVVDSSEGGDRLVLIDWDEARKHPKSRESQGDAYLDLLHPERLRGNAMLYTKVQLALLYRRLRSEHVELEHGKELAEITGFADYRDAVQTDNKNLLEQAADEFVSRVEALFRSPND